MSSVRLRKEQAERLRRSGYGPEIIRMAVERYRRGDFGTLDTRDAAADAGLVLYPIWKKPEGVKDALLRRILDAHWTKPDGERAERIRRELDYWRQVAAIEKAKVAAMGSFIVVKEAQDV